MYDMLSSLAKIFIASMDNFMRTLALFENSAINWFNPMEINLTTDIFTVHGKSYCHSLTVFFSKPYSFVVSETMTTKLVHMHNSGYMHALAFKRQY